MEDLIQVDSDCNDDQDNSLSSDVMEAEVKLKSKLKELKRLFRFKYDFYDKIRTLDGPTDFDSYIVELAENWNPKDLSFFFKCLLPYPR